MPADIDPRPATGKDLDDLQRQVGYFSDSFIVRHLLDALPNIFVLLNSRRQVVYANRALLELLGLCDPAMVQGLRPGEALDCLHAAAGSPGCGETEHCRTCGALMAVLESMAGQERQTRECRLTRVRNDRPEAMEMQVWATPFHYQGEQFTIFALQDVSHEKRRVALERIFFHDILNVLGSIKGFAELLRDDHAADRRDIFSSIVAATERTIDEIEAQRLLVAAEARELQVRPGPVAARLLLSQLREIYRHHEVAARRQIHLDPGAEEILFTSDRTLLGRVIGNMLKNALEAIAAEEAVTIGCRRQGERIEFWVHNPGYIPPEVQRQIFQRSYSTRGPGRGLGTYGMRLLSSYLQGEISFTSSEAEGTIFRALYPPKLA